MLLLMSERLVLVPLFYHRLNKRKSDRIFEGNINSAKALPIRLLKNLQMITPRHIRVMSSRSNKDYSRHC